MMSSNKLPLLDYISKEFKDINLENMILIASQHLLDSNKTMFRYFLKKGLKPSDIFIIGKCYSSNLQVFKEFKKMEIYISPKSIKFDSHESFDKQFEKNIIEFLKYVKKKIKGQNYKKLLILEDGGHLISNATKILGRKNNIIGIEQTSAGYEKLKNMVLKFPVINVARSKAKLRIESPLIAKKCIKNLKNQLKKDKLKPKNILIVGLGSVGNEIYNQLKKSFNIKKYDFNKKFSDFKEKNLNQIIRKFDMIIGNTGKEIIGTKQYKYLKKGTILVSTSSSDREFSSVNLRKLEKRTKNCHKTIIGDIIILNSGFPINFDGKRNSSPPNEIQITLSLLFSAVCLAVKNNYKNGLIELDKNIQNKLIKKYKEL